MNVRSCGLSTAALFLFATATATPALKLVAPKPTPAPTVASCPSVLLLESTDGRYYVAVFAAHAPTKASFALTLYSRSAVYNASIPNVTIDKPVPGQPYEYRASAEVIKNVDSGELLGASVAPSDSGSGCSGENVIIPSVASLNGPNHTVDPAVDALEQEVGAEAPTAPVATPVAATGITVPACEDPFDDATPDQIVRPALTAAQRSGSDLGSVGVLVDVATSGDVLDAKVESSSGNASVDALALDAARQSTFHPARFACQPIRSSHVMRFEAES